MLEQEWANACFALIPGLVVGNIPSLLLWVHFKTSQCIWTRSGSLSKKTVMLECILLLMPRWTLLTQGQQVEWKCWEANEETFMSGSKLFLDCSCWHDYETISGAWSETGCCWLPGAKGEPSWSRCTSIMPNVDVPGLELVPYNVSQEEAEALVADLMGPQAPWLGTTAKYEHQCETSCPTVWLCLWLWKSRCIVGLNEKDAYCLPAWPALPPKIESVEENSETLLSDGQGWEDLQD